MPTFNEGLGTSGVVWTAWRFAAVPRGIAAERLKFLEGAIEVAMHDREVWRRSTASPRATGSS